MARSARPPTPHQPNEFLKRSHAAHTDRFYGARYSHSQMKNPDFVLLAQSMGVHAIRCHNTDELPDKMREFLAYNGSRPVLLECMVERNEHVFPMVRRFL
jgi:acetolactate synthase I/II/III large subunit